VQRGDSVGFVTPHGSESLVLAHLEAPNSTVFVDFLMISVAIIVLITLRSFVDLPVREVNLFLPVVKFGTAFVFVHLIMPPF
jgi:hypothetical protein